MFRVMTDNSDHECLPARLCGVRLLPGPWKKAKISRLDDFMKVQLSEPPDEFDEENPTISFIRLAIPHDWLVFVVKMGQTVKIHPGTLNRMHLFHLASVAFQYYGNDEDRAVSSLCNFLLLWDRDTQGKLTKKAIKEAVAWCQEPHVGVVGRCWHGMVSVSSVYYSVRLQPFQQIQALFRLSYASGKHFNLLLSHPDMDTLLFQLWRTTPSLSIASTKLDTMDNLFNHSMGVYFLSHAQLKPEHLLNYLPVQVTSEYLSSLSQKRQYRAFAITQMNAKHSLVISSSLVRSPKPTRSIRCEEGLWFESLQLNTEPS